MSRNRLLKQHAGRVDGADRTWRAHIARAGKLVFNRHVAGQRKLATILHAKLVLDTHAGHYIFVEQPDLAITAIRQVVDQVRRRS